MTTDTNTAAATEAPYSPTTAATRRKNGDLPEASRVTSHGRAEVMTRTLYLLIGWVMVLSLGHHLDHLLRGVTGWPFESEVNAFTYSLAIYPTIVAGVLLSRRGLAGPRFWALLSSGGALFILFVHVGPGAGDSVTEISGQYASPAAGLLALAELGLFVLALFVTAAHDVFAWRRARRAVSRRPWSRRRRVLAWGGFAAAGLALASNAVLVDADTQLAQADVGQIVALPGGDLQVREDGPRGASPVVLIHGFGGSLHRWEPAVPALAERHRVIRLDLLGHGGSEKPRDGYSIEGQARQVALALGEFGVREAIVVGHSMGGMVAAALAEQDPGLVRGLVLEATPPARRFMRLPAAAKIASAPVVGHALERVVSDGMVKQGLSSVLARGVEVPRRFVTDFRRPTYRASAGSRAENREFLERVSLDERLKGNGLPLLVVFGDQDGTVDPGAIEEYKEIPGARLERVGRAGHNPVFEQPRETVPLILDLAEQLGPGRQGRRKGTVPAG